jgi:hypothetical protein
MSAELRALVAEGSYIPTIPVYTAHYNPPRLIMGP